MKLLPPKYIYTPIKYSDFFMIIKVIAIFALDRGESD